MMNVKELIKELKKMPGDAKVLAHVKELGGFIRIEKVNIEDARGFGEKFGKFVVVLDEKPFQKEQNQEEELENLCPECSMYCEERFTDGQCK